MADNQVKHFSLLCRLQQNKDHRPCGGECDCHPFDPQPCECDCHSMVRAHQEDHKVTTDNDTYPYRQIPTASDIPMHGWYPYHLVHRERMRAHEKHDGHGNSMERAPWDDRRWLPVLTEEVGELARAICELTRADPMSDDERASWLANLRSELIQVAAMATAWLEAIPRA